MAAYLLVAVALGYFVIMAGARIRLPGLDYDEVLFVNAATGGASDSYVVKRVFGVPVMVLSYIGALKAYLYYPIFAVLGVSAETIRWPVILISVVSLALLFAIARLTFDLPTSALLVVVTALDPTFIFLSKLDFGPIVLMMLLKLVALWCFFRAVMTGSAGYLWGVAGACVLGVFDKLNFIWFVVALVAAAVVLFPAELRRIRHEHPAGFAAPLLLMGVALAVASVKLILPQLFESQGPAAGLLQRLPDLVEAYAHSMDGRRFYLWLTGAELTTPTLTTPLTLAALLVLGFTGARRMRRGRSPRGSTLRSRLIACHVVLFCLIAVQIAGTGRAGGPHHMMMLFPFHHVIVLAGAAALPQVRVAVPLAATLLAVSEIRAGVEYARAAHSPESVTRRWSPAIYQLADYLEGGRADRILFVDWGMHNQVYALGGWATRAACRDVWLRFKHAQPPDDWSRAMERDLRGRRVLAVAHPAEGEIIHGVQARFAQWASARGMGLRLERRFVDRSGRVIYEVYVVVTSPPLTARAPATRAPPTRALSR